MAEEAPGEFEIIARYFSRPARRGDVSLGVGDDAALLDVPSGRQLVAAIDTIVSGIHFPAATGARAIGHRALAVNLSDLAAMGADPAWALLSLSMPQPGAGWLKEFAEGFFSLADRWGVTLVGGDTVRGPLVVTVQVLGTLPTGTALTRSGASPGDVVYVSGIPGEAAAGLAVIQQGHEGAAADGLRERFLWPEPRVALGQALRGVATAAMDVSDGLLTDLRKLCQASNCAARVDLDALPPSIAMRGLFPAAACERFALAGGDDYELLFTVPAALAPDFERETHGGIACARIGEILSAAEGERVQCFRAGRPAAVDVGGFDHFAPGSLP